MGKLKTKKMIAKRFRVTRKNKVIHRASGQDHFNGRESGNVTRAKRTDKTMAKNFGRTIKRAMKYTV